MKDLYGQALLEYSRAAVAVLRSLAISGETMSYGDFARAVGLLNGPEEKWQAWHRQQTDAILNATAAVERLARNKCVPLEYDRVVNRRTGTSGPG